MLSRNNGKYVEESVRSVFNQTYKKWVLMFVDDSETKDDTICKIMTLREEGVLRTETGKTIDCINIAQSVHQRGDINIINSVLHNVHGRWIAFLNVGDVWASDKLEKQIGFMEEHGYAFSYTQYRLMDSKSQDRGFLIGGKEHVSK